MKDPDELHNLYSDPAQEAVTAKLKATLSRLSTELEDDDQFADEQPPRGVDGLGRAAARPVDETTVHGS